MGRIVVTEFVTLDGVMQDPGGTGEMERGGWSFDFWSDDLEAFKWEELQAADAQLLGRVTYEGFASAWPTMTETGEFGEKMNSMPKHVVSTTLRQPTWHNTTVIADDVPKQVADLRNAYTGDILVAGSSVLLETLMKERLVDEYRILVHPVILGAGKKLFRDGVEKVSLKLVSAKSFDAGVVALLSTPAD
jgi:dihydrofolate reductase